MTRLILLLMALWGPGVVMAQESIPAAVFDLCRTLRDQIVNRGDPSVLQQHGFSRDLLNMPRPAGGGVDIGAIECDSGTPGPVGQVTLVLEAIPPAPAVCQEVRWRLSGDQSSLVGWRLVLGTKPPGSGTARLARVLSDASIACASLPRPPGDSWWATLQALDVSGAIAGTSNEVELRFATLGVPQPKPPIIPPIGTLPPPLPRPILPPMGTLPPLPPGGGGITETDVWQGRGAMPRPPPPGPPGSIVDTDVWQGRSGPSK